MDMDDDQFIAIEETGDIADRAASERHIGVAPARVELSMIALPRPKSNRWSRES